MGIPQCVVHSLYGSKTRGPEDDSVESKHVALLSHYIFNIATVMFDQPSSPFSVQTLRSGTPQVQRSIRDFNTNLCVQGHRKRWTVFEIAII